MAAGFRLTRYAQQDLTEIRRHTVQAWGQAQSRKYLQDLRTTLELLAEFPGQGVVREDVGGECSAFPMAATCCTTGWRAKQ